MADNVVGNGSCFTGSLHLIENAFHRIRGFRSGEFLRGHAAEFVCVVSKDTAQRSVEEHYFTQQIGFEVSFFDAFQNTAIFFIA